MANNFSFVSSVGILCSEFSGALTFEDCSQPQVTLQMPPQQQQQQPQQLQHQQQRPTAQRHAPPPQVKSCLKRHL